MYILRGMRKKVKISSNCQNYILVLRIANRRTQNIICFHFGF